ncbi:NADH dehydrogenase [ubiquinone] iron-sulfur protein 4, mitochondrial-like [Panonychus citri]|uniref:NADH dehydrogenase [ubiquinone] iron-sulfur protein 4, mitochondrial-like n=1 Tax=Panonychus citri TaxID=50023 RepID=UPI002307C60D|nr:NADH dehydrogenase [ubiquinone] iron-sulfur protein 4, mitochondrial-like [Panonychus citri]
MFHRLAFTSGSTLAKIAKSGSSHQQFTCNSRQLPIIPVDQSHLDSSSDVSPQDFALVSGMPEEHTTTRRVRVFKEAKNAMQSGNKNTNTWKLDFENRERWENPLMGWTSTGDPISNLSLKFNCLEEAIAFCEKNVWSYSVDEPPEPRKPKKKSYADNFSWNKRIRVGRWSG